MLECACACDGDSEGIFDQASGMTSREYRVCEECGSAIWPWEEHTEGSWWDCSACPDYDYDGGCDDAMMDVFCHKGRASDSDSYMCKACASACDQLLCGCWWVGMVWEQIADRNEMSVAECLGVAHG